jgi:hypothetical protein
MIVRNKCTRCKHKWKDQPGAFATSTNDKGGACCPKCGSIYFKWSSYSIDIKKNKIEIPDKI